MTNHSKDHYNVNGEPQSQSKLFRHFAVSLPSQCWCARFGQLTVIKKHREDQENGPEKVKKNSSGCVQTIFVRDCVGEGTEFEVTKLQAN